MKYTTRMDLRFEGTPVTREPTFWERISRAFGGDPDLRTADRLLLRDVLSVAEDVARGLREAGVDNALALYVDGETLYQDRDNRPNDADLLVGAIERFPGAFAQFKNMVAVFEHTAGGLHFLVEASFRGEFEEGEAPATVSISARSNETRPLPNEDLEVAKARIEKIYQTPGVAERERETFNRIAYDIHNGLRKTFPDARVGVPVTDVTIAKPSGAAMKELKSAGVGAVGAGAAGMAGGMGQRAGSPAGNYQNYGGNYSLRSAPAAYYGPVTRYYDPWDRYYYDPFDTWVSLTLLHCAMHHPFYVSHPVYIIDDTWHRPIVELNYIGDAGSQLSSVDAMASTDWSSAQSDPSDAWLNNWDAPSQSPSGSDSGASDSSWSGGDSGGDSSSSGASDCTSDCTSTWDCTSDCTSDCASSWDCASSDCASSDCSSDCGSSDCSSSD